jgi:hypothetical protein
MTHHRHGRYCHNEWHAYVLDRRLRHVRRRGGDELVALQEYQRDLEERLADVTERIRRVEDRRSPSDK